MWLWIAGGLAAVGAACLLRSEYEKKHLSVERFTIRSDKLKKARTFVFLSDLHDNEFGPDNISLVNAIDQVNPDAVLIGGDMMICKGERNIETSLTVLRQLAACYPVYYANGNHESRMNRKREVYGDLYDEYQRQLKALGIVPLYNAHADFGEDIVLYGIEIDKKYYQKMYQGAMEQDVAESKLGKLDEEKFNLLLAHSPMFFDAYEAWGADLTLAGHFHGGTVRLPFLGGLMTPQYQFFLPWCAGSFEQHGRYMIVSRGLGTHSINIRFNNKPQLVVVELRRQGAEI